MFWNSFKSAKSEKLEHCLDMENIFFENCVLGLTNCESQYH